MANTTTPDLINMFVERILFNVLECCKRVEILLPHLTAKEPMVGEIPKMMPWTLDHLDYSVQVEAYCIVILSFTTLGHSVLKF